MPMSPARRSPAEPSSLRSVGNLSLLSFGKHSSLGRHPSLERLGAARSQKFCIALFAGLLVLGAGLGQIAIVQGSWNNARRSLWEDEMEKLRACTAQRLANRVDVASALTAALASQLVWEDDLSNRTRGAAMLVAAAASIDALRPEGAVVVARQAEWRGENASVAAASAAGWTLRTHGGGCTSQGAPSDKVRAVAGCGQPAGNATLGSGWPPCETGEPLRCRLLASGRTASLSGREAGRGSASCTLVVGNSSSVAVVALLPCAAHCHPSMANEVFLLYDAEGGVLIDGFGSLSGTSIAAVAAAFEDALRRHSHSLVQLHESIAPSEALNLDLTLEDGAQAWASAGWLRPPRTLQSILWLGVSVRLARANEAARPYGRNPYDFLLDQQPGSDALVAPALAAAFCCACLTLGALCAIEHRSRSTTNPDGPEVLMDETADAKQRLGRNDLHPRAEGDASAGRPGPSNHFDGAGGLSCGDACGGVRIKNLASCRFAPDLDLAAPFTLGAKHTNSPAPPEINSIDVQLEEFEVREYLAHDALAALCSDEEDFDSVLPQRLREDPEPETPHLIDHVVAAVDRLRQSSLCVSVSLPTLSSKTTNSVAPSPLPDGCLSASSPEPAGGGGASSPPGPKLSPIHSGFLPRSPGAERREKPLCHILCERPAGDEPSDSAGASRWLRALLSRLRPNRSRGASAGLELEAPPFALTRKPSAEREEKGSSGEAEECRAGSAATVRSDARSSRRSRRASSIANFRLALDNARNGVSLASIASVSERATSFMLPSREASNGSAARKQSSSALLPSGEAQSDPQGNSSASRPVLKKCRLPPVKPSEVEEDGLEDSHANSTAHDPTELLRARLIWKDALRGVELWEELLFVSKLRLRCYEISTGTVPRWIMTGAILFHMLLGYWEPSGNWNGHVRPPGWEAQAGCPRLYDPYPWTVPMRRDSVQPVLASTFAPIVTRLEWICVSIYISGLALMLFALRASYFLKRKGNRWRISPRWRIARLILVVCMLIDALLWHSHKLRLFRPFRPMLLIFALPNLRHYAQMVITSTRNLWGLFLLFTLVIAYFTLYGAYFFGDDACTCEPPCNASQRVPIGSNTPCSEDKFQSVSCLLPAMFTLVQTDNFPDMMYPAATCRTEGSPRAVPILIIAFVFCTHLVILNIFLTTYYSEFRRDQKLREKQLQVRERRSLVTLFMLLTNSAGIRTRFTKKGTAYRSLREARLQGAQWVQFILGPEAPTAVPSARTFPSDAKMGFSGAGARRQVLENRILRQFDRHAQYSGEMDIMQFFSLFEEVIRYRLAPEVDEGTSALVADTSSHELRTMREKLRLLDNYLFFRLLRHVCVVVAKQVVRLQDFCFGRYISEDGQWIGIPRMFVMAFFAAHVIKLALCIEFGFGHCNLSRFATSWEDTPTWCLFICELGGVWLMMHALEMLVRCVCSGAAVVRKHGKADLAIVGFSLLAYLLACFPHEDAWRDYLIRIATTLPTTRLISFWRSSKSLFRHAFRGIAPSYPLLALILCLFYTFAMLGIELLGCIDGLGFGADPSLPHASFDTLDWSLITIFQLFISEGLDEVRLRAMAAATNASETGVFTVGDYVVYYFSVFQMCTLVLSSLFIGSILHNIEQMQYFIEAQKGQRTPGDSQLIRMRATSIQDCLSPRSVDSSNPASRAASSKRCNFADRLSDKRLDSHRCPNISEGSARARDEGSLMGDANDSGSASDIATDDGAEPSVTRTKARRAPRSNRALLRGSSSACSFEGGSPKTPFGHYGPSLARGESFMNSNDEGGSKASPSLKEASRTSIRLDGGLRSRNPSSSPCVAPRISVRAFNRQAFGTANPTRPEELDDFERSATEQLQLAASRTEPSERCARDDDDRSKGRCSWVLAASSVMEGRSSKADTSSKFSTVVSAAQRQARDSRRQDRTARWTFCRGQSFGPDCRTSTPEQSPRRHLLSQPACQIEQMAAVNARLSQEIERRAATQCQSVWRGKKSRRSSQLDSSATEELDHNSSDSHEE